MLFELNSGEYWENPHVAALEDVRLALRDLVKFIDRDVRNPVFTYFEDTLGEAVASPSIIPTMGDFTNYRQKVEKYIQEHKDSLVIRKLIYNEKITSYDIRQLEHFLFEGEIGSKADFEKAYPEERSLGKFIRNIVGLDRQAAKMAFAEYLDENNFTGNQISFINQIIDYLTQNGTLEPARLFEVPFDEIHSGGISGVFGDIETGDIINIVESINMNADVAVS